MSRNIYQDVEYKKVLENIVQGKEIKIGVEEFSIKPKL